MDHPADDAARSRVIEHHLPLVASIARRYAGGTEPLDDLMQVGAIGLIKAVDRFDPARGSALRAFAAPVIEGEIRHHLRDAGRPVRRPRPVHELDGRLRAAERRVAAAQARDPTAAELAREVGTTEHAVADAIASRRAPVAEHDAVGDGEAELARCEARVLLADAWKVLDDRERETSGIDSCTTIPYGGPDGPATLTGTCRDRAGNVSAPLAYGLSYDASAPALTGVGATAGDGVVTVTWSAGDAERVTVTRAPGKDGTPASVVFDGQAARYVDAGLRNGVTYAYTVTATDAAGNAATAPASGTPRTRLLAPRDGVRFSAPPLLRWKRVRRADYYNVQLFRGNRKILSSWPTRPQLRLRRTWRYLGRRQRLVAGTYRWYVWPGYGRRARHDYGRLLGTRQFTIAARRAQ